MNDIRYGIFLRPDPATCWAVTQITFALQKQFGLVSAGAFPPHATLIGNLATDSTEKELIAALEPVFARVSPIPVYNRGIDRRAQVTYEYNVNLDESGANPNEALAAIAADVKEAILPLSKPVHDYLVTPVAEYEFGGHLGLASHDLSIDARLSDEVGEFIAGLPVTAPASFSARWYSLFEFRSDWNANWWETMTWRHVKSWDASTSAS